MKTRVVALEEVRPADVATLLSEWKASCPAMGVLSLVAEAGYQETIRRIQAECGSQKIPLRGAVFPALVLEDRFLDRGALFFRLDSMPFSKIYSPLSTANPERESLIEAMCSDVRGALGKPRASALFLVFDAMLPDIASMLDEIYLRLADGVRYFGVNAGSETFRPIPCLFDNDHAVSDGLLALLLDGHPGAVVEHGYQAPVRKISATAVEGNKIISIDWRPAFEVYREVIREEYGHEVTRETFYEYAVHFPFGILRASGEILVRIPVSLEPDGSLFCVGEVPSSAILTLLRAPAIDSQATIDSLGGGLEVLASSSVARAESGSRAPALAAGEDLLTFYCAGRRLHLGEPARDELRRLAERTRAGRIAGALSLGEIGHSLQWGYPLFHNGALVCSIWAGA